MRMDKGLNAGFHESVLLDRDEEAWPEEMRCCRRKLECRVVVVLAPLGGGGGCDPVVLGREVVQGGGKMRWKGPNRSSQGGALQS